MEFKEDLTKVKVGDYVLTEGMTSMAQDGGYERVSKIKTKYNEDTGKPYKVICCKGWEFDSRNGYAITSPTIYYIMGFIN